TRDGSFALRMWAWLGSAAVCARVTWCTSTPRWVNTRCLASTYCSSLRCLQAPRHATSQTDAVSVIRSGRASKSAMGKCLVGSRGAGRRNHCGLLVALSPPRLQKAARRFGSDCTGNDRQGITFHTNTNNTPSGQPDEGYTWHMKKTFSDKVRDIVRKIPKGKTMTYKEVASKAGNPKAARAVGAVMRSNYDPSIPCHRVVASDGKMRGYNRGARIR